MIPESNPSFYYYENGHAHCYSCGFHGTLVHLVGMLEFPQLGEPPWSDDDFHMVLDYCREGGLAPGRASPRPRRRAIGDDEYKAITVALDHYRRCLRHAPGTLDYLRRRGLSNNFGTLPIGWCSGRAKDYRELTYRLHQALGSDWMEIARRASLIDKYGREFCTGRLMIAEVRDGKAVYFQARALRGEDPKYKCPYGLQKLSMGTWSVRPQTDTVFIVEGPFDMLPIVDRGGSAIATLGNGPAGLVSVAHLLRGKDVWVATDWDLPTHDPKTGKLWKGELMAKQILDALAIAGIPARRLPQVKGCNDLGEWAEKYPEDGINNLILAANC